jgi:hypothetical protein
MYLASPGDPSGNCRGVADDVSLDFPRGTPLISLASAGAMSASGVDAAAGFAVEAALDADADCGELAAADVAAFSRAWKRVRMSLVCRSCKDRRASWSATVLPALPIQRSREST